MAVNVESANSSGYGHSPAVGGVSVVDGEFDAELGRPLTCCDAVSCIATGGAVWGLGVLGRQFVSAEDAGGMVLSAQVGSALAVGLGVAMATFLAVNSICCVQGGDHEQDAPQGNDQAMNDV